MILSLQWVVTWILLARVTVGDFAPVVKMYEVKDNVYKSLYFDDSSNVIALKRNTDSVMASYDDGVSWTDIDMMKGKGVLNLVNDPVYKNRAYAISYKGVHFVTTDKGKSWTQFTTHNTNVPDSGNLIYIGLSVNAQDPELGILKFARCPAYNSECPHFHYYTTNGFNSIELLTDSAEMCTFAMSTPQFAKLKDPSTVVCSRVKFDSFGHIVELQLVASSDFFKTERRIDHPILRSGKVIDLRIEQLFMVAIVQSDKYVAILVSKDTQTFDKADLKFEESSSVIILKSSPLALFLLAQLLAGDIHLATMYRSDSSGLRFTELIENVEFVNPKFKLIRPIHDMRSGSIHKLQNVDGVWFATVVAKVTNHDPSSHMRRYNKISKISVDDGQSWTLMEVVEDESCQLKDGCSLHVEDESCQLKDGCSLHVHEFGQDDSLEVGGPTPNILIASGTTGEYLGHNDYKTYMSRDGGLTWKVAIDERTVVSYGDQGNIIVAFPNHKRSINKGYYSLDQGFTWADFPLVKPIREIQVGTTMDGSGKKFVLKGMDVENSNSLNEAMYSVDFTNVFDGAKCLEEDLEKVYARVSGDLVSCVYGHRQSFMRRKPDAKCYVSTLYKDMKITEEPCDCTEHDFECSSYFKVSPKGDCVPDTIKIAALCASQKKELVKVPSKQLQTGNQCKSDPQSFITIEELKCSEYPGADTKRIVAKPNDFEGTLSQYAYTSSDDLLAENLIFQTLEGIVYASNDGGRSFVCVSVPEKVLSFFVGPSNGTVVLITDSDVFYYSKDSGNKFTKLQVPGKPALNVRTISFHPDKLSKFIWFSGDCGESDASDCVAYYTKDSGETFQKLLDNAIACDYVSSAFGIGNPELVYCIVQSNSKKSLVSSRNFFNKEPTVLLENIVSYAVNSGLVVAVTIDSKLQELRTQVTIDGITFAAADFPGNFKIDAKTPYNNLHSDSNSIFMHITTDNRLGLERGAIFKSNSNGTPFVLSLDNVNRNTNGDVDYERVRGIQGVLMANTVHTPDSSEKKLKTQISFNDGGQWSYIPPPNVDSEGKNYTCSGSLTKCSLNLRGFTERLNHRDTYSSTSAVGILIGTGNVGETLEPIEQSSTFLSTDAGLTWKEIAKGVHHWEYGDQGTILVLVSSQEETNEILYSTDGGHIWQTFQFVEKPVSVLVFTTVLTHTIRKFVIFAAAEDAESKFTTYSIDFTNYFERQCLLDLDNPDKDDYEYWTPKNPESIEGCLLGHQEKFLRRDKNHTDCFIGAAPLDQAHKMIKNCSCMRNDYECDYNYFRDDNGTCSPVTGLSLANHTTALCKAPDIFQYFEPTGYRKILLSTCAGGMLYDASEPRPCPGHEKEFNEFYSRRMGIGMILLVVLLPLVVFIAAAWFVYDRGIRRNGGFKHLSHMRLDDDDFSPVENNFVDVILNRVVRGGILVVAGTIAVLKLVRKIDRTMIEQLVSSLFGRRPGRRNYVRVPGDEDELFGSFETDYDDQLDDANVNSEVQGQPGEPTDFDRRPPINADASLFNIDEQSAQRVIWLKYIFSSARSGT